ncbi:hypothetical protein V4R08_17835 (plasmid) [Nitrobacter sp. NHB1]|uniref:hypothetical protein n=1 Tax=Nitrobacter sp. NHB1 TaxID=3119830 RepID=UPI0030008F8C
MRTFAGLELGDVDARLHGVVRSAVKRISWSEDLHQHLLKALYGSHGAMIAIMLGLWFVVWIDTDVDAVPTLHETT